VSTYRLIWGRALRCREVDRVGRKSFDFSYRALDPGKANRLNDKIRAVLIDPRAESSYVVPSLEQVGHAAPERDPEEGKGGKSIWMGVFETRATGQTRRWVRWLIGQFRDDEARG